MALQSAVFGKDANATRRISSNISRLLLWFAIARAVKVGRSSLLELKLFVHLDCDIQLRPQVLRDFITRVGAGGLLLL